MRAGGYVNVKKQLYAGIRGNAVIIGKTALSEREKMSSGQNSKNTLTPALRLGPLNGKKVIQEGVGLGKGLALLGLERGLNDSCYPQNGPDRHRLSVGYG